MSDAAPTDENASEEVDRPNGQGRGPDIDVDTAVGYLMWGALVGLGILAVVATAGLYGSLSAIIDVWVARRYQPFARSALNFAVLCVAAAGIVVIARRLRRS
ncbi:MAG: hypothetical protein ACI8U4_002534 [Natronomonas sp.]|jgi:hypothetical protein